MASERELNFVITSPAALVTRAGGFKLDLEKWPRLLSQILNQASDREAGLPIYCGHQPVRLEQLSKYRVEDRMLSEFVVGLSVPKVNKSHGSNFLRIKRKVKPQFVECTS